MPKATKKISTPARPKADPIFAAIENHRKLDRTFLDLWRAQEAGLAKRREVDRASEAADNAAWKLARTKPTTAAGAAAMLAYIATHNGTGLFELGEMPWHEDAFRAVTAALARMTRTSQRAA